MTKSFASVRDELWKLVEPLLPAVAPAKTGRPRVPDRAAFSAIMFVLFTGVPWKLVPREFGVSGSTAHQRFTDWTKAGVFARLHAELLRSAEHPVPSGHLIRPRRSRCRESRSLGWRFSSARGSGHAPAHRTVARRAAGRCAGAHAQEGGRPAIAAGRELGRARS